MHNFYWISKCSVNLSFYFNWYKQNNNTYLSEVFTQNKLAVRQATTSLGPEFGVFYPKSQKAVAVTWAESQSEYLITMTSARYKNLNNIFIIIGNSNNKSQLYNFKV